MMRGGSYAHNVARLFDGLRRDWPALFPASFPATVSASLSLDLNPTLRPRRLSGGVALGAIAIARIVPMNALDKEQKKKKENQE